MSELYLNINRALMAACPLEPSRRSDVKIALNLHVRL